MSKVIYKPAREKRDECFFRGGRLAWLYPEGTIIESHGHRWVKVEDHVFDSFGWWAVSTPTPKGPSK